MFSIEYLYSIADRFSAPLKKMAGIGAKFDGQISKIQAGLGKMEDKFKSSGAKLANLQTGLASIGAGVFLKGALEESIQFQKSLNMTKAVTSSSAEQMEIMRSKALEWGSQTQFSSLQVAGAMAELGKMGNKTNQIIDLMPGTMALAAAGEISMAEAATFSMQAINQMGLELSDAEMVADTFATGAANASTSVAGLASAFSNTGLAARGAGLDMNTTTIALMALASQGQEGAHGGTMLKNSLLELQKMTPKVRKGFDGLGIDIDNFRNATTGQVTDLFGLIDALKETGDVGIKALGDMFGKQALQGMSALVGTSTEKMNEFRDSMKNVSGGAERMKDDLMAGLEPFTQFESVIGNLKVIVGSFVLEAINPLLEKFNKWLGDIQQNNPQLLKMITYFLMGVTALGAILIPLGLIISSMGSLFGVIKVALGVTKIFGIAQAVLSGIFGLSGTAIATTTATTTAYLIGAKIAAAATKVWSGIQMAFNAIMSANPIALIVIGIVALIVIIILLVKNWDKVKAAIGTAWEAIKGFIAKMWNILSGLLDNPFFVAIGLIALPWITVPALIIKHWAVIRDFFISLWGGIKSGFFTAINAIKLGFFTFADVLLSVYGNVFKTIVGIAAKVGGALGLDVSGLETMIAKVDTLQKSVREKSAIGGSSYVDPYIGRTQEAPVPGLAGGANANATASVSVYTEKGMGAKPWVPSGDLGYNMTDSYQRGAMQ